MHWSVIYSHLKIYIFSWNISRPSVKCDFLINLYNLMKYNRVFDYVHHHWIGNFVHPLVPNAHTALLVFIVASEEFRNNSNIPRFINALSFILYLMAQKFNKSWFSRNQNDENTNTQRCCGTLFDAAPDFPHVLSYLLKLFFEMWKSQDGEIKHRKKVLGKRKYVCQL